MCALQACIWNPVHLPVGVWPNPFLFSSVPYARCKFHKDWAPSELFTIVFPEAGMEPESGLVLSRFFLYLLNEWTSINDLNE